MIDWCFQEVKHKLPSDKPKKLNYEDQQVQTWFYIQYNWPYRFPVHKCTLEKGMELWNARSLACKMRICISVIWKYDYWLYQTWIEPKWNFSYVRKWFYDCWYKCTALFSLEIFREWINFQKICKWVKKMFSDFQLVLNIILISYNSNFAKRIVWINSPNNICCSNKFLELTLDLHFVLQLWAPSPPSQKKATPRLIGWGGECEGDRGAL